MLQEVRSCIAGMLGHAVLTTYVMCVATLCSYIRFSLTALKFCCAWNLDAERQVYQIFHIKF